jgi:hypothetical protein
LTDTFKTKINTFKALEKETTNIQNQIYPVDVSGETSKVLPIKSNDTNFVEVSLAPPVATGAGRTVNIDLKDTVKTKINTFKGIENEETNILNQIYPVDVSGTTAKVLPIMPRTPDFVEVSLGLPISQGAGRTIGIDLKDTIRTKINNMQTVILNDSITATQVQPAIIYSATKTVSLLPIENMDSTLLNIYQRSVGPVHGQTHSVAIDLTTSLKTKLGKIKDIKKEDTSETDYIYPVEVDGTNAVATVLPIQAFTNDHINVSLALPLTAEKGRSIQIDLSESTKTKVSKIREIRREATNALASSLYAVDLNDTSMTATFLPFVINPVSAVDVFPVYPTEARSGKAIGLDLKQSVKTIINNVSLTQFSGYPNMAADARFYKLGRLNLPNNGHQAVITVNLCYGFNFNNTGLNMPDYQLSNYEMKVHLYSSTPYTSRKCFPESFPTNSSLITDVNYSLFHNGYVTTISPFVSPLGVYLTPVASDNRNNVDIWIHSYMWHGYPLIQVSQTSGSFTKDTVTVVSALPLTGFVKLDIFSPLLSHWYKNPHNTLW